MRACRVIEILYYIQQTKETHNFMGVPLVQVGSAHLKAVLSETECLQKRLDNILSII